MKNVTASVCSDLFSGELKLLNNDVCAKCSPKFKSPLLPWIIGSEFFRTKEKLVFVGKPHRGDVGEGLPCAPGISDPTLVVENELWKKQWPYWAYTRKICENIYGDHAAEHIVLTNIVKCSNSDGHDTTPMSMVLSCLSNLMVVWKEIELLQARTLVFYTYNFYPHLLEDIPIAISGSVSEIYPRSHSVPCGQKNLGWWERDFSTSWTDKVRLLVVGHPERKNKSDFVKLISDWIKS